MLLLTGDMNAKVGTDNSNYERAMGRNNNGERLADICISNNLVFPHKNIHKLTLKSPDGRTSNQIDHVIINGKWRRSLQDVRAYWLADAFSDHDLIAATIKLKLKKSIPQGHQQKKQDIAELQYPKKNKELVLELRNSFSTLETSPEEETPTVSSKLSVIKTINSTKGPGLQTEWRSANTLKAKALNTKAQRLLDKEVKMSARRDERVFVEHL